MEHSNKKNMIRSIAILLFACSAAISVVAQNKYEEVIACDVQQDNVILTVTVKGIPHKFLLDITRSTSAVFPEYTAKANLQSGTDSLKKIGIGQNLFVKEAAVERLNTAPTLPGIAGILGHDLFKRSILTINKKGKSITLSAPYKPAYMPLRSRAAMSFADTGVLLDKGVVSFDFTRNTMYFAPHETLDKTATLTSVKKERQAEGAVIHLNRESFLRDIFNFRRYDKWKYQGDMPCIIDFWATWCVPCRRLDPILRELAKEYEGRVKFYKVNADEEKEIADGYFDIHAIPLLLYVPLSGEPVREVGVISKEAIRGRIEALLGAE